MVREGDGGRDRSKGKVGEGREDREGMVYTYSWVLIFFRTLSTAQCDVDGGFYNYIMYTYPSYQLLPNSLSLKGTDTHVHVHVHVGVG